MAHDRRTRIGRSARLGALASAAVLTLTACGGGGGGGTASSCDNTLTLGILTAFSGELGDFGKIWQEGFDLAVKEMKSSGELPSEWTIDTVVDDEKSDIQEGVRAATAMIKNDEVSAILGPTSGPVTGMVKLAERTETPIVSSAAGTVNLNRLGGEWVYRTVASDSADGEAAATWLADQDHDDVVLLVQNDQSTVSVAKTLTEKFKTNGGTITKTLKYNAGQPTYQSVVQQATAADPGAIFLAGGQESGVTILKELRSAGYPSDQIVVSADMTVPKVIKAVGADWAQGMQGEAAQADAKRDQYKAFAQAYKKEYSTEPGLFVPNSYDAAMLVGLAAVAADSTCGSDINEQLRDVSKGGTKVATFAEGAKALAAGEDIDYQGASGPVDLDKSGTVTGSYAVLQVKGDEWEQVKFYPASTFAGSGG